MSGTPLVTRPMARTSRDLVPWPLNPDFHAKRPIRTAGTLGLHLSGPDAPMMRTGHDGWVPAAHDPSDPSTWRVGVIFT